MGEGTAWFEEGNKLLPRQSDDRVEGVLFSRVEREYCGFCGVCYEGIANKQYDFVFVDSLVVATDRFYQKAGKGKELEVA